MKILSRKYRKTKNATSSKIDPLDRTLAELNFSVRVVNAFEKVKIVTVGDLVTCSFEDLVAIKNLGHETVTKVLKTIAELGVSVPEKSKKRKKKS